VGPSLWPEDAPKSYQAYSGYILLSFPGGGFFEGLSPASTPDQSKFVGLSKPRDSSPSSLRFPHERVRAGKRAA